MVLALHETAHRHNLGIELYTVGDCAGIGKLPKAIKEGFGAGLTVNGLLSARGSIRFEPQDLPPENPSEGDAYMNANTHKLMVYDGTSWKACW